jgi:Transposase
MDGFTGFKTAAAEELPDAVAVMGPFHVARLAGDALDLCSPTSRLLACGRLFGRSLIEGCSGDPRRSHGRRPRWSGRAGQQQAELGGCTAGTVGSDPGPAPSPAVGSLAQSQSSRTVMYQPGRSAGATVKWAWPWPLRWDATGKSWVKAQV